MKGWPVTVHFKSEEDAQKAAAAIGNIVGEYSNNLSDTSLLPRLIETWGKPSLALTVGRKETTINAHRKTAWDR